ncbi:MAG: SDR family oxidoreductase [Alphaproteobacteria bacterium]|jgi:3-oxoacyl-[acyl-carrier protein] reductase|nr:SDR family oxidoreductase [Alphaproteobacteria bacterium]MDP6516084.1 SDR family oxidoreductase [Alphaproteobacteria bacterium]
MTSQDFAGRTALVTGGSRGLGRAICTHLGGGGARVAINYRADADAAHETQGLVAAAGGPDCALVQADVSDPDSVAAMVGETERALGPIDLLVTSAGIAIGEDPADLSFDTWRRTMAVNVDGTYLPVVAVKDAMVARKFGRIVCIASIAALRPRPLQLAYGASKAAVIAFVRSISEALAPDVRINCIAPGLIETDMAAQANPAWRQDVIDGTPMKRMGQPEEIAELAGFLLSERASFTTGQTYVASGGRVTLP